MLRRVEKNAKNEEWKQALEDFIKYKCGTPGNIVEKLYYEIQGSGYTYLFLPDKRALRFILARLSYHRSLQNKLATTYLSVVPYIPKEFVVFDRRKIRYPEQLKDMFGEFVVISGVRMKIFNFSNKRLYTLPLHQIGKKRLKIEVETRRRFENRMNIPKILYYDEEFPYLVEKIVGYPLHKLDERTWHLIVDVFKQLRIYYKENGVESVSMQDKLKEIKSTLREEKFKKEHLELIMSFIKILDDTSCGDLLTTITHGDIYLGNLVTDGKNVYITDWELPRKRLIVSDFVYMLFRYYIDSGSNNVIYALLTGKENMHKKYIEKILEEFDKNFDINLSDTNTFKCYFILGMLERIPLFESSTLQKLIFTRLKKILQVITQ